MTICRYLLFPCAFVLFIFIALLVGILRALYDIVVTTIAGTIEMSYDFIGKPRPEWTNRWLIRVNLGNY